ncbi:hypothetical protein HYS90_00945 [Candidatus Curtissbacteria bacterium]|nr:hypothetical protein [Candidatus Curtissbacteria bacterium]
MISDMTEQNVEQRHTKDLLSEEERTRQNHEAFAYLQYLLDGHRSRLIIGELPRTILFSKEHGRVVEVVAQYPPSWEANDGVKIVKYRISENGLESVGIKGELRVWGGFECPFDVNKTIGENGDLRETDIREIDPLNPMTAAMEVVDGIKSTHSFAAVFAEGSGMNPKKGSVAELSVRHNSPQTTS